MSSAFSQQSYQTLTTEIENTLQEASAYLDAYLKCNEKGLMASTLERVAKLNNIFELTPYRGVKDLNRELVSVLQGLLEHQSYNNLVLNALCQGMLILPRYVNKHKDPNELEPQLLLPYINSLRAVQSKSLFPEMHYSQFQINYSPINSSRFLAEPESIDYIRQMYLWGLLGYMKNDTSEDKQSYIKVLKQALLHVHTLHNDDLWLFALAFIESIENRTLSMDIGRKRLLSDIDKQLRLLKKGPLLSENIALKKDLLYLIHLADSESKYARTVFERYHLPLPTKDDRYYQRIHAELYSPSRSTVDLVIEEIRLSIDNIKAILLSLQPGEVSEAVIISLKNALSRSAALLSACGMEKMSAYFYRNLEALDKPGATMSEEQIKQASQKIVVIEKELDNLTALPGSTLVEQRVMSTELKNFQGISALSPTQHVIQECEKDLEQVMQLIENFVSDQQATHYLEETIPVLSRVRTCLEFIQEGEGMVLIQTMIMFINTAIQQRLNQQQLNLWLNSLADAIILVEQYLITLRKQDNTQEILELAQISTQKLIEQCKLAF